MDAKASHTRMYAYTSEAKKTMRAWRDVYENLCREVGTAYGLNDIREA